MSASETEARESQTRLGAGPHQQPSWPVWMLMKGFRLLFLTVLWTGIGMGVGLLTGILVLMTGAVIHHRMPPMDLAYRNVAIPTAILAGSCSLLWNLVRTVQAAFRR